MNETIHVFPNISSINNTTERETDIANEQNTSTKNKNNKMQLQLLRLRKSNKMLRNRIQKLEDKIKNNVFKKAVINIFNKDQITTLCSKQQKAKHWSNETIRRVLRLKLTYGNNGYEKLLQQRMPLPSLRTLQRKLENLKFRSGISNNMFKFLK